ncbi:MAG: SUMF1/EgtB/PvdO family nonheme iron enzyme [Chloroflexi bacterium]|nr:SUMF1/EgtB/PvdO family nonheme iron enzyme [Chloroflexota bacterium]
MTLNRWNPCFMWGQVKKVLRGGSWNNKQSFVRAANRNNNNPDNTNNNIGFRCVVPPRLFLNSQVHYVYGCHVSA